MKKKKTAQNNVSAPDAPSIPTAPSTSNTSNAPDTSCAPSSSTTATASTSNSSAPSTVSAPSSLPPLTRKNISVEGFVAMGVILAIFVPIGAIMGFGHMLNTMFKNALLLLTETCFYLMGVAVIIGALSSVMNEFGVISIFNRLLKPFMKPVYGMPGATSLAIFSSFLSDNPAVLTLAADRRYRRYFKKYQLAALTNIGTAFGMGLIVIITMLTKKAAANSGSVGLAVGMGVIGAVLGSVLATRLMLLVAKKAFGKDEEAEPTPPRFDSSAYREVHEGGVGQRLFTSLLEGGESGVKIGLAIIPGVLIIANLVMLLSNGKIVLGADGQVIADTYEGLAGQGVGLIPWIGDKLGFIFKALFGFENSSAIAIPLTALGSAGAAVGIVTDWTFTANEIAVFTAMCMFWSGYLSTHVSMMDNMGFRKLTGWSILFHTISGIVAGISANLLFQLFALLL